MSKKKYTLEDWLTDSAIYEGVIDETPIDWRGEDLSDEAKAARQIANELRRMPVTYFILPRSGGLDYDKLVELVDSHVRVESVKTSDRQVKFTKV
jgi:hypothetical protein